MKVSTNTEWLLFHLWKKNPQTNESCPGIFCLDTIIYRWAKPFFWYFTNSKGQIIRKTKESITNDLVYSTFTKSNCPQNVAALYLQCKEDPKVNDDNTISEVIEVEHMEKEDLNFFLYRREKSMNSILQKFVISKDDHNSIIKINWSPQFYLINRRTNIHTIGQTKIPLNERLSTFEGPDHLLAQDNILSPTITQDIEQLCQNIVRHIQDITGGLILIIRMVLYFKLDSQNRLWLLYCTHLKTKSDVSTGEMPLVKSKVRQKSPILIMKEQFKSIKSELGNALCNQGIVPELKNNFKRNCSNCEKACQDQYKIKFSSIIESFDKGAYNNKMTVLPQQMIELIEKEENDKKMNPMQRLKLEKQKKKAIKKFQIQKTQKEIQEEQQELRNFVEQEQKQTDFSLHNVPALITKVWGGIDDEKYQDLKKNQSWMKFECRVCDDCYLLFTKTCLETDFVREMKDQQEIKLKKPPKKEIDMFQAQKEQELENQEQLEKDQQQKDKLHKNVDKFKKEAKNTVKMISRMSTLAKLQSSSLNQQQIQELEDSEQSKSKSINKSNQLQNIKSLNQIQMVNDKEPYFQQEDKQFNRITEELDSPQTQIQMVKSKQVQQQNKQENSQFQKVKQQNNLSQKNFVQKKDQFYYPPGTAQSYKTSGTFNNKSTTNQSSIYGKNSSVPVSRGQRLRNQEDQQIFESDNENSNQIDSSNKKIKNARFHQSQTEFFKKSEYQNDAHFFSKPMTQYSQKRQLYKQNKRFQNLTMGNPVNRNFENINNLQQSQQQTPQYQSQGQGVFFRPKPLSSNIKTRKNKSQQSSMQMFSPDGIYQHRQNVKIPKAKYNNISSTFSNSTQDTTQMYSFQQNNSQQQQYNQVCFCKGGIQQCKCGNKKKFQSKVLTHGYMSNTLGEIKNSLQVLGEIFN